MEIKNEIRRRLLDDEDVYQALGAEIKRQRLARSQTLSSIADKNCSVSYLCKIERNQIRPSKKYLKDICEKVNISEEKMKYLLSSKKLLLASVKRFYFEQMQNDKELIEKLEGLDNHRIELIRLIYNCSINNIAAAEVSIKKLVKLTSALAGMDLMILATFYGVYLYKLHNYVEAAEYLKLGIIYNISVPYIKPIQRKYLFECAAKAHSINTGRYYFEYQKELIIYGNTLDIEKIHYEMAYYYLIEEQFELYEFVRNKVLVISDSDSLDYIYYVMTKNKKMNEIEFEDLNQTAKIFYMLENKIDEAYEYINNSDLPSDEKYFFIYQYYKKVDLEKAYDFLIEVAFSNSICKNMYYQAIYYLDEIANSIHRPNKYKRFFDMYKETSQIRHLVNQI